jgi:tryptophan synthase beta chain
MASTPPAATGVAGAGAADAGPRPDRRGYFGPFGGRFVPETVIPALEELERAWEAARVDPAFLAELEVLEREWVGRPTPLYPAARLSQALGCSLFLKREDLCHTGAHKVNNTVGQLLLARRMGKQRIVAETGAGQHGVATAATCARFGLECVVYMGETDMARQRPNVERMRLLGAKVVPVTSGSRTLKDATNEALRDWVTHVRSTHYVIGSVVGPHPYPWMVRELQSVIGREARAQMLQKAGALPDVVVACVGGGSNAAGMLFPFVADAAVRLVGVEAGGRGPTTGEHCMTLSRGEPGVLHGARSLLLQDQDGLVADTHSISAGLDYPGVGPEHSHLKVTGRIEYAAATDAEALAAFQELCRTEGIIPALESSHALAYVLRERGPLAGKRVLVNLSGRGDKDLGTVLELLGKDVGGLT